jgi:signal transduction histidine kinase
LETRYDQLDDDQRRNLIERLAVNADHLAALLADLLDLDHVEVQALLARARPLRLRAIVESTLQRMPGTDGVDWEVPDAEILGDAARLGRAIGGLVANALGHASSATAVRIRGEVSAAKVVLRVEDDGPGVPASIRDSLFTAFVQGPAAATSPMPGMGIGLATVEQVATMHGGDVWYEDVEPHGARFCLRLPLAPDVAPEVASDTPSPTAR